MENIATLTIAELFPEGLSFNVRTGDKTVDGKHVTAKVVTTPAAWSREFLAIVIDGGARAVVAEKLNTEPTEGGVKLAEARKLFAQADRGEMPAACVRTRAATGGSNPVLAEAIKLAKPDVFAAAKVTKLADAVVNKLIGKFWSVSKAGTISDNVGEWEKFIAKNDEKKNYMARAQAIVEAKAAPEESDAIEL